MNKVLIVDDEKLICDMLKTELEKNNYDVTVVNNSKDAIKAIEYTQFDIVLLDLMLPKITGLDLLALIKEKSPDTVVIIITAYGSAESAVKAMKLGAFDYINKPFSMDEMLVVIKKAEEYSRKLKEINYYKKEREKKYSLDAIVGSSKAIKEIKELITRVAEADVKVVLIEGESGVGKELIAKAIHGSGKRAEGPFIAINCASVPETLLESELFGYEKGAFTDAKSTKQGLIELADGGSLFLDEIGDMPMTIQAKMLRFLEERKVRRVGGLTDIPVDVQIIAATNKILKKLVQEGKFREDLYYRIKVVPIYIPPLRERREDIVELANYFIKYFNSEFKKNVKGFSPIAMKMIMQYDWPGNIRELRNVIERAMIFEDEEMIMVERLPAEIIASSNRSMASGSFEIRIPQEGIDIEEVEKELIRQALTIAKGNQSKAARLLNIGVDAMRYRMKKFGFLK
ncbi:MAG: sigma-54 dependent transcriptional regulator [Proteobacteria bacterium]|nr:sigma-54 dependent transcriptional regulator [Pseudomonadota bacterium]